MSNSCENNKLLHLNGLYTFGGFRLDVSAGLLTHSGVTVKLAPKVYLTLVFLLEHRERVIAKEELFQAIWADTFVEDNALSYTISQLRKALAAFEPGTVFIETIPRRGFRFVASVEKQPGDVASIPSAQLIERQTVEELWIEEIHISENDGQRLELTDGGGNRTKKWLASALLACLVLVTVSAVWLSGRTSETSGIRAIAVMPLQDISGTGIDQSLLVGMTYALIAQLGRSTDLVVRPLSSTVAAASSSPDPIDLGKKLSVDSVVEWNMQLVDGRVRVNARLINVADGRQLWKETIDYSETDPFKVQDAVSTLTADALLANISEAENKRLHRRPTVSNEAYQAYLRGRFHWNQRTLEGFKTAQGFFEQAVVLDPKFADAHAGLADVHLGFYDYGYKPAVESVPFALVAIERALQLDPDLSDAYSTLGSIKFLHDHDMAATESNLLRAIELAPNDPTPRLRYGWMLSVAGRRDEGLAQLKVAETLDPTSYIVQTNLAYNLMVSGRLEEAEEKLLRTTRNAPNFSLPHWYLGAIYFLQGRNGESIERYLKAYALDEGKPEHVEKVREALRTDSPENAFRFWRQGLERRYSESYFPPSNIALVAALQKDRDSAIRWLRKSQRLRDPWLLQVIHDPEYSFLKGDPEFEEIVPKLYNR